MSPRLEVLRDHITRLPPTRFDMGIFIGRNGEDDAELLGIELEMDCGTAGCLAGWTVALFAPDRKPCALLAAKLLDISAEDACRLFTPRHKPLDLITTQEAAQALNHLITFGEVQWPH